MAGVFLILAVFVLLTVADVKIYKKEKKLNLQIENAKNKTQEMQSKNTILKQNILEADNAEYIEKIAREELDLQKPGEKVVSFIKESNQQEQKSDQNKKSILQLFLGWVSGK